MSFNPWVAAGGGLVVVLSLWFADHSLQIKDQAVQDNAALAEQNAALVKHSNRLAFALADQAAVRDALSEMNTRLNQTQSTLSVQTGQINRSLAELKRDNEQITTYLASPVPSAIGVRYARTETTDPVEYRARAASVRADVVPSSGPSASDR